MKFDLLLLFALVGSFCTITHASTLVVPTEAELAQVTGALVPTEASEPSNDKEAATGEAVTSAQPAPAATDADGEETKAPSAHPEVPVETTGTTSVPTEAHAVHTEVLVQHTEASTEAPETTAGLTEAPVENTEGSVVKPAATEGTPEVLEATSKAEAPVTVLSDIAEEPELKPEADHVFETEREEVEVEDSEGMSTGHVVGIVFGALVAVVIIIAVIVVVVRRMGQYSP